jgi:predicted acyl esterase
VFCFFGWPGLASQADEPHGALSKPVHEVKIDFDRRIPMRDGLTLSAEIYRPASDGRYPVILAPIGSTPTKSTAGIPASCSRRAIGSASSAFPKYDRNPNTGAPLGQSAELKTADETIYHDRDHPSHVVLPVIQTKP